MRLRDLIALVTFTLLAAPAIPAASQTVPASSAVISQSPAPPASAPAIPPQQLQMSRIPAIAIPALGLETSVAWKSDHDEQTRGWSTGSTHFPIFPDGHEGLQGR